MWFGVAFLFEHGMFFEFFVFTEDVHFLSRDSRWRLTLSFLLWRRWHGDLLANLVTDEESILLKTLNRGIILFISLFLRGVLLLVTWQEVTKKQVQKPTVSKYFPYAQNARGAGVLGAPMWKLPAHSEFIQRRLWLPSARRLGFCSACSEGTTKLCLSGGVCPPEVVFVIMNRFAVGFVCAVNLKSMCTCRGRRPRRPVNIKYNKSSLQPKNNAFSVGEGFSLPRIFALTIEREAKRLPYW